LIKSFFVTNVKRELGQRLSFLEAKDSRHDMLYKYYEVLNGIQFNFNLFNQLLTEEIKEEDEQANNLKDTRLVAEFQLYLTNLFMSADAMTKELDVVT
jgi:hypothetical protein